MQVFPPSPAPEGSASDKWQEPPGPQECHPATAAITAAATNATHSCRKSN